MRTSLFIFGATTLTLWKIAHSFDQKNPNFSGGDISKNIANFGLKFFLEMQEVIIYHSWKFCQDLRCFNFLHFCVGFMYHSFDKG